MDNEQNNPSAMISLKEAAAQLGDSTSGLRRIVNRTKQGKPGPQIQFFQAGAGKIKFRQKWLDDFINANSIEPGQIERAVKTPRGRKRHAGGNTREKITPIWATSA